MPIDDEVLIKYARSSNIASDLDNEVLSAIGQKVHQGYEIDVESRSEWTQKMDKAMKMALQVSEPKSTPWPNASNIKYPLMTTAAIQFAARAYAAMVPGSDVVKGKVVGSDRQPSEQGARDTKRDRAHRIGKHMSWQLIEEMEEWEEETDRLLHIVPVTGLAYRKTYYDPMKGRNVSVLVMPDKLVVNNKAKSLETSPRITEEFSLYPYEITERMRSNVFMEMDLGPSNDDDGFDEDAPHIFLEQHCWYDLDEDGYPEPYIVTIHRDLMKVVRIVARFEEEGIEINKKGQIAKIEPVHYYTKYPFIPSPDGSWHDIGFGILLAPINDSVNTSLNQMMDAGTLQNTGGGFIGSGLRVKGGVIKKRVGEWKVLDSTGEGIAKNIVPLNHPGPSAVLFQLLGMLVDAGKEIASIKDVLMGETKSNVPATTTLAMIEQGMKTFTAIYKRLHRAMKKELKKLYRLNSIYLADESYYTVLDEEKAVAREDYAMDDMDVVPVSDPTVVTDMQKMARAQFLMDFLGDPMFNGLEIRRRLLDAASIEDPSNLIVDEQPPDPQAMLENAKFELEKAKLQLEGQEVQSKIEKMSAEVQKIQLETEKLVSELHNPEEDNSGLISEINRLQQEGERLKQISDQKDVDGLKLENERQLTHAKLELEEKIAAREAERKDRELEVKAELERAKLEQEAKIADAQLKQKALSETAQRKSQEAISKVQVKATKGGVLRR